jgi:hypothetical protein
MMGIAVAVGGMGVGVIGVFVAVGVTGVFVAVGVATVEVAVWVGNGEGAKRVGLAWIASAVCVARTLSVPSAIWAIWVALAWISAVASVSAGFEPPLRSHARTAPKRARIGSTQRQDLRPSCRQLLAWSAVFLVVFIYQHSFRFISGFLFWGIFPNISNLGGLGNKGLKLMRCKEHTNLAWFLLDQDEKTLRYLSKVGFSPISLKNKLCHNKLAQLPLRSK